MPKREHSKWTNVYFGAEKDKPWYIRLVPDFMELEKAGLPHGLSISGNTFATREEAEKAADFYDKFFDKMAADIIMEYENPTPPLEIEVGEDYTVVNGTKFYHDDDIQ